MRIVFATHNSGKLKELRAMFKDVSLEIMGMDEVGITDEPVEDGKTFATNAAKKALFVAKRVKEWVFADDSGICISALNWAPGVLSARWAGKNASGEEIAAHTILKLAGIPLVQRTARFECVIALVSPTEDLFFFAGKVHGRITEKPRGNERPKLPYDTIFEPDGHIKTFAEISEEEKNSISHRAKAAIMMKDFLLKQGLAVIK